MRWPLDEARAALYARVSSDQQAAAGTIASQVAALEEQARRDGLALEPGLCFLDDGYSGSTLVRPALERLRDLAAAGGIDRLYVHSPDRLARKYAYQVLLVEELRRGGAEVVFLNQAPGRTPEDELLLQVQGVVAEYERAKMLERTRRGRRHAALCGNVSVLCGAPYGYRYVPKAAGVPARYDVLLEEARVVRDIFAWVGHERLSLRAVCRRLAERGVPSPTGQPRWSRRSVYGVVKNAAYMGGAEFGKTRRGERRPRLRPGRGRPEHPRQSGSVYVTPAEERVAIPVPPLVSAELFALAGEQLRENRRRYRESLAGARYLLQGLVVCKVCGYAVCGRRVTPPNRPGRPGRSYVYYCCGGTQAAQHGGAKVCHTRPVRGDVLEQAVWHDVQALLAEPEKVAREHQRRLSEAPAHAVEEQAEHDKQRRQVERGLSRLIDAYAEGLLDKAEFEPRLRRTKERLSRLEAEAQEKAAAAAQEADVRLVVGRLQDFAEAVQAGLREADWQKRREIIRTLVKRIEVDDEEVRVIYRINPHPFVEGPDGGLCQDCAWRGPCHANQETAVKGLATWPVGEVVGKSRGVQGVSSRQGGRPLANSQ
ncbi:MAG TPA: recombinase family protein [Gemmataceae bacterium]|nr:recombinase family protein [Gemmataceae bacterium]